MDPRTRRARTRKGNIIREKCIRKIGTKRAEDRNRGIRRTYRWELEWDEFGPDHDHRGRKWRDKRWGQRRSEDKKLERTDKEPVAGKKEEHKKVWRLVELHEIPTTQKQYEEKLQIEGFRDGLIKLGLNPERMLERIREGKHPTPARRSSGKKTKGIKGNNEDVARVKASTKGDRDQQGTTKGWRPRKEPREKDARERKLVDENAKRKTE